MTDIGVSYDGSWPTRGYRSQLGIGSAIDMLTGYVVDYEVMSKSCRQCAITKSQLGENSPDFNQWYEGHKNTCDINHTGSSGAMEMMAAETIWKRSTSHGLRYKVMLSDGDAKTIHHLNERQVYGPDEEVEKEECVNHASKRYIFSIDIFYYGSPLYFPSGFLILRTIF